MHNRLFRMVPLSNSSIKALPWVALMVLSGVILWLLSPILMPFVLGALLAYLCDPFVRWVGKKGIGRIWGALFAIVLIGLALTLLILLIVPLVWREGVLLVSSLPRVVDLMQDDMIPWINHKFGTHLQLDDAMIRGWLTENWDSASQVLHNLASRAGSSGAQALGWIVSLLLVPMVMFYLMTDWPGFMQKAEEMVPRPWHARFLRIMREIDSVLGEFVRGQLSVMLILAVFYSVGLWIGGLTFWAPVGIVTGLLIFIPYVGFGLGLLLALLVATLQFEGWSPLIGVAIVYGIGQLVESMLLTPFLVGERIGLHPLAAIFALMAFGQLFGFTGVLVALPVCAASLVALRELRQEYFASEFYQGKDAA